MLTGLIAKSVDVESFRGRNQADVDPDLDLANSYAGRIQRQMLALLPHCDLSDELIKQVRINLILEGILFIFVNFRAISKLWKCNRGYRTKCLSRVLRVHLHIASKMPSSKLHRSCKEFFVPMHEFFEEASMTAF